MLWPYSIRNEPHRKIKHWTKRIPVHLHETTIRSGKGLHRDQTATSRECKNTCMELQIDKLAHVKSRGEETESSDV